MVDRLLEFAHLREQRVVVGVGIGKFGRDLVEAIHHRLGFGNPVLHVLQHCLRLIELRLLHQDADREPVHEFGFAIGHVVHTSHDLQQTRLTRSIGADDPDLGGGQESERDVVQDDLVTVRLARLLQCVDELGHGHPSVKHGSLVAFRASEFVPGPTARAIPRHSPATRVGADSR